MDQPPNKAGIKARLASIGWALWRLLGRMGLAFRLLLTWIIWIPIYFLTMPLWLPVSWAWEFFKPVFPWGWRLLGRMGLAIRQLWYWMIWEPLLWLLTPLFWVARRVVWPALKWLVERAHLFTLFLWRQLLRLWRYGMRLSAPKRHLWRRSLRSRWVIWRAKARLFIRRPSTPKKAQIAPIIPQTETRYQHGLRLATAFATVAVLLIVGIISLQERQTDTAVASDESISFFQPPEVIILTPTPLPASPTPQPTAALTPWPTPDLTKGGGAILFSQHQNGNSDIYLLPVGQSEAVRITSHPAQDREPSWSPDGSRFAFASNRGGQWDIYMFDIRRGELVQVTNDLHFDGAPSWSPDGEWLAYESYQDGNLDIFLVALDDVRNPIQLTRNPAPDYAPSWEPLNGRHITFTSWRSGGPDIFIRSLDDPLAERVINVTNSPDKAEDAPVFSPDGRLLAFTVTVNDFTLIDGMTIGSDVTPIGVPRNLGQQGEYPAWSPNNEALVYVFNRNDQTFLVAGSPEAWGVTPQVYGVSGEISSPSWTAVQFTPDMLASLNNIDGLINETLDSSDAPLFTEAVAEPVESQPPVQLFELTINAPSPYLSDRVDQSFLALRQRIIDEAGWDLLGRLDRLFVPLDERPLPGQPIQDWNKAGRAFDISYQEAVSFDPRIEVVPERIGDALFWRVYVKTALQDGTQGEPLRALPWDFRARTGDDPQYYDEGGKLRDAIPEGYFVDLTAVAKDYGWMPVAAGPNWKTYFPDIRFWHFENRQGLTWQQAMQEIYTPEELSTFP